MMHGQTEIKKYIFWKSYDRYEKTAIKVVKSHSSANFCF